MFDIILGGGWDDEMGAAVIEAEQCVPMPEYRHKIGANCNHCRQKKFWRRLSKKVRVGLQLIGDTHRPYPRNKDLSLVQPRLRDESASSQSTLTSPCSIAKRSQTQPSLPAADQLRGEHQRQLTFNQRRQDDYSDPLFLVRQGGLCAATDRLRSRLTRHQVTGDLWEKFVKLIEEEGLSDG
jgi:hypothetical protein